MELYGDLLRGLPGLGKREFGWIWLGICLEFGWICLEFGWAWLKEGKRGWH